MKNIALAALVSLFAMGTASADAVIDITNDANMAHDSSSLTNLPPTAAGKTEAMDNKGQNVFFSPDHG